MKTADSFPNREKLHLHTIYSWMILLFASEQAYQNRSWNEIILRPLTVKINIILLAEVV